MSWLDVQRFHRHLGAALGVHGWRRSDADPIEIVPEPSTYIRPLRNGWVAVLKTEWKSRDDAEEDKWLRGMHGLVTVESSASFPDYERLAAQLELEAPSAALTVAPEFEVSGQEPGQRQYRGTEDYDRVVVEIVRYANDVVAPAAERTAELDAWLAAYDSDPTGRDADPDDLVTVRPVAWQVPVMLLAHGRANAAQMYTADVLRSLSPAETTSAYREFASRLDAFVAAGDRVSSESAALSKVAADRRGAAKRLARAEREAAREPVTAWEAVGGLLVIVALPVWIIGKSTDAFGVDLGWGWLPAAAAVAFAVLKVGEYAEQLRDRWQRQVGGADRVHEYLERARQERTAPEDADESRQDD